MSDIPFKTYDMNQPTFLPPSLDELVGTNARVRFVHEVVEAMDLDKIIHQYSGEGCPGYHPRMMVKVLLYGYVERICSCRKIARALGERVDFMWLTAGHRPDFRTINYFRKHRLRREGLRTLFAQIVERLVDMEMVDLSDYTLDGTVIEAYASPNKVVWKKNAERYKRKVIERMETYFDQIQTLADIDQKRWENALAPEEDDRERWTSEYISKIKTDVETLVESQRTEPGKNTDKKSATDSSSETNEEEKDEPEGPSKRDLSMAETRLKWIFQTELDKLKKYERQQELLDERNSYSVTDPDATFMRMKDQSPFDKLLHAGYNLQMGAQAGFVLGYSLHHNASDNVNMAEHLQSLDFIPERVCADAGYDSLYNFEWLDEQSITAVIKPRANHQRKRGFSRYDMDYDPDTDTYRCPEGRPMVLTETADYFYGPQNDRRQTQKKVYQSQDCSDCPVSDQCKKGKSNRTIRFIPNLEAWKQAMKEQYSDPESHLATLARNRGRDIEGIFGLLKENDQMRRLTMRGMDMADLEIGLKAIGHNLRTMQAKMNQPDNDGEEETRIRKKAG